MPSLVWLGSVELITFMFLGVSLLVRAKSPRLFKLHLVFLLERESLNGSTNAQTQYIVDEYNT